VVVRTKKDGLSFGITKLHLSAQLLECTENLQIEPTLNRSLHAKFLENLIDEELALSKCIAKSRKSSLAGFIIKQDFFVLKIRRRLRLCEVPQAQLCPSIEKLGLHHKPLNKLKLNH